MEFIMVRTSFVAAASLLALSVATSASAADLPRKSVAPVFAQVPAFSWTGFYVGLNAGVSIGDVKFDGIATGAWLGSASKPPLDTFSDGKADKTNFTGGFQLGYNYQFGAFVAGVEADVGYFSTKKTTTTVVAPGLIGPGTVNITTASGAGDYLVTLRGRLGVAFDRFLIYATGGLAISETRINQRVSFAATNSTASGSSSKTATGYVIGGGVEYALTNNWTIKGEYMYLDLGKNSAALFNPAFPTFTHAVESRNKAHIIRAGVNYKF
jgi:outer membrane immunogenic protein